MAKKAKRSKSPLFRAVGRVVEGIEDIVDEAVARGELVERDARRLVDDVISERKHDKKKKHKKSSRTEPEAVVQEQPQL